MIQHVVEQSMSEGKRKKLVKKIILTMNAIKNKRNFSFNSHRNE